MKSSRNIDIEKLVELKENNMSDKQIAQYLNEEGIKIVTQTVAKKLRIYYKAQGRQKPRSKLKSVDVEKLVELKENNMSDKQIAQYLNEKGIKIVTQTVAKKLRIYYKAQGRQKPKSKVVIPIEEAIQLDEQGMSSKDITKFLEEIGVETNVDAVVSSLREYYKKQGKEKPKKEKSENRIPIHIIEKIIELKDHQMSDKEITEYLNQKGFDICKTAVCNMLNRYYKKQGEEKPKAKKGEKAINKSIRLYDNDIEEILMSGMTIQEFVLNFEQHEKEDEIREKVKKLRVVAEYFKKENDKIIPDRNFLAVLDLLENLEENPEVEMSKYAKSIGNYIHNGFFEQGKIEEIRNTIFSGNTDLMMYVILRLQINVYQGYDKRMFRFYKKQYKGKIDKYLKRIELIDENRKQIEKTNSDPNSSGDER